MVYSSNKQHRTSLSHKRNHWLPTQLQSNLICWLQWCISIVPHLSWKEHPRRQLIDSCQLRWSRVKPEGNLCQAITCINLKRQIYLVVLLHSFEIEIQAQGIGQFYISCINWCLTVCVCICYDVVQACICASMCEPTSRSIHETVKSINFNSLRQYLQFTQMSFLQLRHDNFSWLWHHLNKAFITI